MNGYNGRLLRVDLTTRRITTEVLDEELLRHLFGGRNLAAWLMLREIAPGTDALGEANKLVITTSMLTGTPLPGSSRFTIGALSPLSGGFGESEAGGWWGPELRFAGFDALVVEGRADRPVYLQILDQDVTIRDAAHIWGKETLEAERIIKAESGSARTRVLQTGIAGENLVRYAAITNELRHWCGRCGLGAVMGSKKLRAIAVVGTGKVPLHDPEKMRELAKWFAANMARNEGLSFKGKYGTAGGVVAVGQSGLLPTRNFTKGHFEAAENLCGIRMYDTLLKKREGCYACPVRCKRVVEHHSERFDIDPEYGGPEFETVGSLGSNCEIRSMEVVCKGNELCGRYGLDTISTGVTIALAMECFEKGLISRKDTDGLDFSFGNEETFLAIIPKIARREGFGAVLAEGSYRAGQRIGGGAERFSMTSKKQEFPAHEPRGKWGVAFGYAVSPTGADHLVAAHDPWFDRPPDEKNDLTYMDIIPMRDFGIRRPVPALSLGPEKLRLFVHLQYLWSLYNVLDMCIFVGVPEYRMFTIHQLVEAIRAATGWDVSFWDVVKGGEKGIQLARLFNCRHGLTAQDDALPDRMFEPLSNGAHQGHAVPRADFEQAKRTYYEAMGWDRSGMPTLGKFVELGLQDLHPAGGK